MVQPLWKTVWCFLTKLNILLLYNPATSLLGKGCLKEKIILIIKTATKSEGCT